MATQDPRSRSIINVGQFSIVRKINNKIIRKEPKDKTDPANLHALKIEEQIYIHLGRHERIARYIDCHGDHLDLYHEKNGDLQLYLAKHKTTEKYRCRVARQAIEAVQYIHHRDVIHADLAAKQFLVDKALNVRLSDFGGSSLHGSEAMVRETVTHFLPRDIDAPCTVQSDIFALGSTLYEIFVGKLPYQGIDEEEISRLYSQGIFPSLEAVCEGWRRVIDKCWRQHYRSADEALQDAPAKPSQSLLHQVRHHLIAL